MKCQDILTTGPVLAEFLIILRFNNKYGLHKCGLNNNKQLLDEAEHDMKNYSDKGDLGLNNS